MTDTIDINISSALCVLKDTLNTVLTQIENINPYIRNEDIMDLRLIFSELLINAIIHGNRHDLNKKVHLMVELSDESVTSIIVDEGKGFNHTEVLNYKESVDNYALETGRGIRLVSCLADELFFNGNGNEIKFVKRLNCMPLTHAANIGAE